MKIAVFAFGWGKGQFLPDISSQLGNLREGQSRGTSWACWHLRINIRHFWGFSTWKWQKALCSL